MLAPFPDVGSVERAGVHGELGVSLKYEEEADRAGTSPRPVAAMSWRGFC
jgi:hypothetical protein